MQHVDFLRKAHVPFSYLILLVVDAIGKTTKATIGTWSTVFSSDDDSTLYCCECACELCLCIAR